MSIKKRTFGFDEYTKLINEGIEEISFRKYRPLNTEEYEEETTKTIDDLGEGEKISTGEEAPVAEVETTEKKDEVETLSTPIDTGDGGDISLDEAKVKISFINSYIKTISSLVVDSDKVALDKATKSKIVKLYNIIQGIS